MTWLERALVTAFPTLLLESTPWAGEWLDKERQENVVLWRSVFPLIGLIYVGHLVLFDQPMGLQPANLWIQFRLSVAAIALACFLFYCAPSLYRSRVYRIPALATCWLLCFTQAQTAVWYDDSQYLYAFVFVVASTMLIRAPLVQSTLFAIITLSTQWGAFLHTSVSEPVLYSAAIATLTFVFVTRSRYADEIRYFLANRQNAESQKRLIEQNIEFSDRIRAFLPLEISRRLAEKINDSRVTVLQAIDEILRPEERNVACLFSDIRGFTQSTKSSLSFLFDGVVPNVKRATAAIEHNSGIPRKIGDLVFAYFDDANPYVNLIRCIHSGISIVEASSRHNRQNSKELAIRRYVLIASGRAIVGNIGGFDSSIEITALGSPVNLLSRIDELTKHASLQAHVTQNDLILCDKSARLLTRLGIDCSMRVLSLKDLGLIVRDFEEMTTLWLLPATTANRAALESASMRLRLSNGSLDRSSARN